jgi:hypothetical protein
MYKNTLVKQMKSHTNMQSFPIGKMGFPNLPDVGKVRQMRENHNRLVWMTKDVQRLGLQEMAYGKF